jgi:hypothetical protein
MPSFIAGAINTGQFDAKTAVVKKLSQIPLAILEIVFALAGAINIRSEL